MASRMASSLERGWFFRRAGHSTAQSIMDAGARGCLVTLSGKITGARHRVEKFQQGHIKFCGETALQFMDVGYSVAVKKLGTVGCSVRIMRPGVKLPHEVTILDRHEVGLPPLEDVAYIIPEEEEPVVDESSEPVADTEDMIDSALEKMAKIESDPNKEEE